MIDRMFFYAAVFYVYHVSDLGVFIRNSHQAVRMEALLPMEGKVEFNLKCGRCGYIPSHYKHLTLSSRCFACNKHNIAL